MGRFYNLPPSWNPGYADPTNVQDEGLERRTFTTAWAPRGSYDDPKVGAGGYALPNYISKEGYGQGAYVTKWAPRGSYAGPTVPHYLDRQFSQIVGASELKNGGVELKMSVLSGMGDVTTYPRSDRFGSFGTRAAAKIIASVMRLPASQRRAAIKAALDAMDPSLFSRAETLAKEAMAKGQTAKAALAQGLAAAITEGMLKELDKAGRTRSAPQTKSLLGLGCYRAPMALGAVSDLVGGVKVKTGQITAAPGSSCAPPSGYTWDVANGTPYLRRLKAGETPKNGPCGATVTQNTGGTGGTTVTSSDTPRAGKFIQLGPDSSRIWFTVPEQTGRFTFVQPGGASSTAGGSSLGDTVGATAISPDAWNDIVSQMQKKSADFGPALQAVSPDKLGKMMKGDGYGLPPTPKNYLKVILEGQLPVYYFTYPGTSSTYGLHIKYLSPGIWEVTTRPKPPSNDPFKNAWSSLKKLFAKIYDVVETVVDEVADMACGLVNSPNAAAAANAASGTGAAIGVGVAQGVCGNGSGQQVPVPVATTGTDTGTLVLLGAGALFVVALVKRKKKKKGHKP